MEKNSDNSYMSNSYASNSYQHSVGILLPLNINGEPTESLKVTGCGNTEYVPVELNLIPENND